MSCVIFTWIFQKPNPFWLIYKMNCAILIQTTVLMYYQIILVYDFSQKFKYVLIISK